MRNWYPRKMTGVWNGLRGPAICLSFFPMWLNWITLHFLLCIVNLSLLTGLLRAIAPKSNVRLSRIPQKKKLYSNFSSSPNRGKKQLVHAEEERQENGPVKKFLHISLGFFNLSRPSQEAFFEPYMYPSSFLGQQDCYWIYSWGTGFTPTTLRFPRNLLLGAEKPEALVVHWRRTVSSG